MVINSFARIGGKQGGKLLKNSEKEEVRNFLRSCTLVETRIPERLKQSKKDWEQNQLLPSKIREPYLCPQDCMEKVEKAAYDWAFDWTVVALYLCCIPKTQVSIFGEKSSTKIMMLNEIMSEAHASIKVVHRETVAH